MAIKVSLIIPTYNGIDKVLNALDSLVNQTHLPDEVIVVIDGSTDNTKAIIESKIFPLPNLKLIEQLNGGRAKVRNRGAMAAQYDLLLFMDDDIIAPKDWVKNHIEHHKKEKKSILTGKLEDPVMDKENDFLKFKSWLNNRWNKNFTDENAAALKIDYPYISANNLSIPKSLFEEIGCFDGRLTDAEDYDLAVRAGQKSIPMFIGNAAWAWHNDITTCRKYIKRLNEYQKAQKVLIELKPEIHGAGQRYNVKQPSGLKWVFFKFFSMDIWVNLIDKGRLQILPQKIRYSIYDYVTTSKGVFKL